jgi:hypothetical protein
MNTDKIVLVVFALFWFALFILSRRFRWDERAYEQFKDSRIMWFGLTYSASRRHARIARGSSSRCGLQCL